MMNDPYSVLGVAQNASDDEIKTAYRELARKYHPDNYADNPLKDLAADKMKEINEAYDLIISQRAKEKKGTQFYGGQSGNQEFPEINQMIQNGQYDQAQLLLDQVPISNRTARWYYLSGNVQYSRGWYDEAYSNYATAHRMEPQNQEYAGAVQHMNRKHNGNGYRTTHYGPSVSSADCNTCNVCQTLICADCCCECMGGDCIPCC
jgi:curved DNA-binding protein CbpA